jgi:hypothetical protein
VLDPSKAQFGSNFQEPVIHQTALPIAANAPDVLVERSMFTRFVASSIAATDQVQRSGLRVMSRRSGMWHDYQANDWRLVMTTEMSAGSGTPEHQSSAGTQSRESS